MRVAILGARGQLAHDLQQTLQSWDLVLFQHGDLDICNYADVRLALAAARPEIVINTAAFHRVDDCEDLWEQAFLVNAFAVRHLAQTCRDLDATLVHISTDYVFAGEKQSPYAEEDTPVPLSVYGTSKLAGEHFVRSQCPKHLVIRSSGLYGVAGSSGKGGNFVETMIRMAKEGKPIQVVDDQVLTPTFTQDLATTVKDLLCAEQYGLVHVTNGGACSWYEFARKIFELSGLEPDLGATTTQAFGSKAPRPRYSVLDHRRLRAAAIPEPRPWQDALRSYLQAKASQ